LIIGCNVVVVLTVLTVVPPQYITVLVVLGAVLDEQPVSNTQVFDFLSK
jgi:hypothetical protein